jgi:hypothetical protein
MSYFYRYVLIKTYEAVGEPSKNAIRARVLAGQGLPETLHVECSTKMRQSQPPGTIFKIWARLKMSEERNAPLYTSWQWDYEVMTEQAAARFLKAKKWGQTMDPKARW